jgi:hypothetical protein
MLVAPKGLAAPSDSQVERSIIRQQPMNAFHIQVPQAQSEALETRTSAV